MPRYTWKQLRDMESLLIKLSINGIKPLVPSYCLYLYFLTSRQLYLTVRRCALNNTLFTRNSVQFSPIRVEPLVVEMGSTASKYSGKEPLVIEMGSTANYVDGSTLSPISIDHYHRHG